MNRAPVFFALLLAGCATSPKVVYETVEVPVTKIVVEPVPEELLRLHPIAEGGVAVCPTVSAQRKAEIEACNADKTAIRNRHSNHEGK